MESTGQRNEFVEEMDEVTNDRGEGGSVNERRYWYLAQGPKRSEPRPREDSRSVFGPANVPNYWEIRRSAEETRVLSIPWWPEAYRWWPAGVRFEQSAPILYTTRKAAEDELRLIEEGAADHYLQAVNAARRWVVAEGGEAQQGEDFINEAVDNSTPYRVYGLDADLLLIKLEDAQFPHVCLDGRLKTRKDFRAELEQEDA